MDVQKKGKLYKKSKEFAAALSSLAKFEKNNKA